MRSRAIAATLVLLLATASACDSSGASEPGGNDGPPDTPSSAASASSSASASPSDPVPATGAVAELGHTLRYRIPEGDGSHVLNTGGLHAIGSFRVEGGIYDIDGAEQRSTSTLDEAGDIELQVTSSVGDYSSYEHTGNRTIDGQEVFVIEARRKGGRMYKIVGVRNSYLFRIAFEWPTSYAAGRDVVESVLATVEWK